MPEEEPSDDAGELSIGLDRGGVEDIGSDGAVPQLHQPSDQPDHADHDEAALSQPDAPEAVGTSNAVSDSGELGDDAGPPVDLTPLAAYLSSATAATAQSQWAAAENVLGAIFSDVTWGLVGEPNPYGPDTYASILQYESRKDFKDWVANEGITLERFTQALGEIQYVSIQIYLRRLFPRAKGNRGWRIRIVSFPALGLIAIGLGSHYQGTQNQNAMGIASKHLHEAALEYLPPDLRAVLAEFPPATPDDWEERGLMKSPITMLGDLDISSFDAGAGARLRMVRNTTVKKDLSTFFAIKGMTVAEFVSSGEAELRKLQRLAISLGKEGRTGE